MSIKTILAAALTMTLSGAEAPGIPRSFATDFRRRMVRNPLRWFGRNKYQPHQGERERARRVGGGVWARVKADDRVRRGLPAHKEN